MHDISRNYVYTSGAARFHNLIYMSIKDRKLMEKDIEHSVMIAYYQGELADLETLEWSVVDCCVVKVPEEMLLAVGEDGEVYTYVGGTSGYEQISTRVGAIRSVNVVEGKAYACGMKREVFRRDAAGSWKSMPISNKGLANGGIEYVTGYSEEELYAVGWHGEIWRYNGLEWSACASPTNQILTRACIGPDGNIIVVGHNGTVISGRDDEWEIVLDGELTEDLWDVCLFKEKLYISSFSGIYQVDGSTILPVDFGEDPAETTYRLTEAEGVLWSVGSDNVFSFDGSSWTRFD